MLSNIISSKWIPKKDPLLRLWLNANDRRSLINSTLGPINHGEFVSKWKCSRFGYEFTNQGFLSKEPVWSGSGFGSKSKPYLQFDGISDILRCIDPALLASLNDSAGTIIVIGANNNTTAVSSLNFVSSFQESLPTNGFGSVSRATTTTGIQFWNAVTPWTAGSNRDIRANQFPVSGNSREVCYMLRSDGSAYSFRTNYQEVTSIHVNLGPNDGNWFADMPGRSNVCVGGAKTNAEYYSWCRIAEVIITGSVITDGSLLQKYYEQYFKSEYGILTN